MSEIFILRNLQLLATENFIQSIPKNRKNTQHNFQTESVIWFSEHHDIKVGFTKPRCLLYDVLGYFKLVAVQGHGWGGAEFMPTY